MVFDTNADEIESEKIVAQDDIRQELIAAHCGLINSTKRYGADATDEFQNEFEIKSGTTKDHISTARDFGFNILNNYKKKYWIIATGELNRSKIYTMNELFVAHPNDLSFFFDKIEDHLNRHKEIIDVVNQTKFPMSIQQRQLLEKMLNRGMTLNDPRIKMKDVRKYCVQVDHINSTIATEQVKEFVSKNPITNTLSNQKTIQMDMFYWAEYE
jgi:hypothetical protein